MALTRIFDEQADRYDAWYDTPAGARAFAEEVGALRPLLAGLPRPWLEVGVGTGRFARTLGVEFGVDPARGPLAIAANRGVRVAIAAGEALPYPSASLGAVVLVVTLCFVSDPLGVLREARRVLRSDGGLVLGVVYAEGPLGQEYQRKAAAGHPYYRHAHFFTRDELARLLVRAGFRLERSRSALLGAPASGLLKDINASEHDGDSPSAGFTALLALPAAVTGRT